MQLDWDIDHPIREHVCSSGDRVLHIYYFASDDWRQSELDGLGEIDIGQKHLHLFLHNGQIYLLRTDGRASSQPKMNEGATVEFSTEAAAIIAPYIEGYEKGQLLPVMAAPINLQFIWYDYLLRRRANAVGE